jgi:hypothetical protein
MPKYLIYPTFTVIYALILLALVSRKDIHRLSLFGIVFGGIMDCLVHSFGYITGLFAWTNYGPFGFIGVHLFGNISWSIFFILFYYFLPGSRPFQYIFVAAAVFASILYYNLLIDIGVFYALGRFVLPFVGFTIWFSIATWGFLKYSHYIEE